MANKLGRNDNGMYVRPLMIAALNDHLNIVQYLIEQCEANANKIGLIINGMHCILH